MEVSMKRILGLGSILGVALMTGEAAAQVTFDVNTVLDGHDNAVGDGQCTTAAGTCSLRAAVEETNALPGADAIHVPADPGV